MTRLAAALGIATGTVVLALLVGFFSSIRIFGIEVVGVLTILAVPFVLIAGFWLKGHGFDGAGKAALTAAGIMVAAVLLQFKLPQVAPGIVAWAKQRFVSVDRAAQRSAIAASAPRQVACAAPYVGADGTPRFWWSPCDDPDIVCYDRPGHHPWRTCDLVAVDPAVGELIERRLRRPSPVAVPVPEAIPASYSREPSPGQPAVTPSPVVVAAPPTPAPEPAPPQAERAAATTERWDKPVRVTARRPNEAARQ